MRPCAISNVESLTKSKIKTLAPLRSSDRRKVTDQIIADYQLQLPKLEADEDNLDEQARTSSGIGTLRNSLLPDGSLSAKFYTTLGPDLRSVSGTIYVGASHGEEQRVLWFKADEKLYPTGKKTYPCGLRSLIASTVYTLWKNPRIVPLLHTPDVVLRKMHGGADLMTPGLAKGPPFSPRATQGSIVAVASLENPSVPSVVGVCEIDISAVLQVQGAKGHAVRTVHWDSDEIWAWSHGGSTGRPAPDHIDGWNNEDDAEDATLATAITILRLADSNSDHTDNNANGNCFRAGLRRDHDAFADGEDILSYEEVAVPHETLSTKGPKLTEFAHSRRLT